MAPDWSADWLHREAIGRARPGRAARCKRAEAMRAGEEQQAACAGGSESRLRKNTYDAATGTITLDADRTRRYREVLRRTTSGLFGNDPRRAALRKAYAMKNDTVPDAAIAGADGVLLVDRRGPRSTESPGHSTSTLHQQLAARAAGRQHAAVAARVCGRCSACCS